MFKKIFKNPIFTFILGIILMGTIGTIAYSYRADQVSFTPNDKEWDVHNVDEAITYLKEHQSGATTIPDTYKDLSQETNVEANKMLSGTTAYNKNGELITGTLPTYTGTTIFSPSYNSQTISTSGKYMSDDIVINAMDVTYKNLTEQTTVTANALLYGVIAYNQSGELITGTIETYNGDTTITPTNSKQTIPTNGKYLNSDITIDAIPSNYKDITSSTISENTILSGYKAYDNNGNLITGNLSTNCASGSYHHDANSQLNIRIGFTPSKYYIQLNSYNQIVFYNSVISNKVQRYYEMNNTINLADESSNYSISSNSIVTNFETNRGYYYQSYDLWYVACK